MSDKRKIVIGGAGQWLGMITVIAGICILLGVDPDPGNSYIAFGSLIFAVGTKIKHDWS